MKLVTFEDSGGSAKPGVLVDGDTRIQPLAEFASLQDLIEGGQAALQSVQVAITRADPAASVSRDSTRLFAPLPRPVQIRDVLCFLEHMVNAGRLAAELGGGAPSAYSLPQVFRDAPRYYKANRMGVVGDGADVVRPEGCGFLDYELELGIVVGKQGKDIAVDKAMQHVFGYTIFNDVSARDLQIQEMVSGLGPAKGKDFDTGNVFGPCISTADSVDVSDMAMIARVNGEEISRGSTSQMDHTVADAVSYISQGETIYPGEIIGSGTVPLGCLMEHKRSLSDGDAIELEIEGIGVLHNRIVGPAHPEK